MKASLGGALSGASASQNTPSNENSEVAEVAGYTPYLQAVLLEDTEAVYDLLFAGEGGWDDTDENGRTPLMLAAGLKFCIRRSDIAADLV